MIGLIMGLAVLFAVGVVGARRWQRQRAAARRPGASLRRAIRIRRFDQMDRVLQRRVCRCGERLRLNGEGSRVVGIRRFRIAHLVCPDCERKETVLFDVTRVFH